jgi:hypothetical protein
VIILYITKWIKKTKDRQCTYKVLLWRISATIVAEEMR